jgi:hypothetical protein
MSKIFFDHLIELEDVKSYIDSATENFEEKEDLWNLVDEFINHKVLITILSNLDNEYHDEFLLMFLDRPYDVGIIDYLDDRLTCPLCELISETRSKISEELEEIFEIRFEKKNSKKLLKKVNK